jgi:hypothetical protein
MPVLGLAFAALVIVSGVWLFFEVTRTRQDQQLVQRETNAPSTAVAVVAIDVGPGVTPAAASPTSLVIPADTAEVQLRLTVQEPKYATHRVILRAARGGDLVRRSPLTATPIGSGVTITLTVPAGQFHSGDYLVTLQGQTPAGGIEDVSQSILRVDKR